MKIVQFTAENIKKLKVVQITPDGNLVQITGANGQGKSSVLDAIYWALAGTAGITSQPVRKGEDKAHVTLDLGEYVVTRSFTKEGGTTLKVEAQNGARFPSPQKMLDEMMGRLTFDPLAFTRMDPKKQLETLRSLVTLDIDIDALDAENKSDFERRTEMNRKVKTLAAQREAIQVTQGLPEKEIEISELVTKLGEASNVNLMRERERREREESTNQIAKLREEAKRHREEAEKLIELADDKQSTAHQREAELNALPPVDGPIDTAALAQEIEIARRINAGIQVRDHRRVLDSDYNDAEREAKELTAAMDKRNEQRAAALAAAKMPLEELSFGDGVVTYKGLPFDQASDAEQLSVSVAIAMAANPQLRVLRIKDGSLLDEHSLQLVAEMAAKSDYQVWIERVDTSGTVGIVMEDGAIKETTEARPQPGRTIEVDGDPQAAAVGSTKQDARTKAKAKK